MSADSGPYLWNLATGKRLGTALAGACHRGDDIEDAVAFSPDGKPLAIAGGGVYDGSARLVEIATGKIFATFADPSGYDIGAIAFSPDGKALVVGDNDDADEPAPVPAGTYIWKIGQAP